MNCHSTSLREQLRNLVSFWRFLWHVFYWLQSPGFVKSRYFFTSFKPFSFCVRSMMPKTNKGAIVSLHLVHPAIPGHYGRIDLLAVFPVRTTQSLESAAHSPFCTRHLFPVPAHCEQSCCPF